MNGFVAAWAKANRILSVVRLIAVAADAEEGQTIGVRAYGLKQLLVGGPRIQVLAGRPMAVWCPLWRWFLG
jgi:hypothetical protein